MNHDGEYIAIKKESTTSPFVVDSFLLRHWHEKTEKPRSAYFDSRCGFFYNFYFLSYTAQSSRKRTLPVTMS